MKNAIVYYYNLFPVELHQVNKLYKFKIDDIDYLLTPYNRSMEELEQIYLLHLSLLNSGYYCHHIVLNNSDQIVTFINGIPYILMKVLVVNKKIVLEDIISLNNIYVDEKKFLKLSRANWYELWIDKIDYIEYQINQFGKKYTLIRESSDYFIGIVENCISLLFSMKSKPIIKTVCHSRIYDGMTSYELYNPLNFIIDNRVRDIGEYFKTKIFDEEGFLDSIKQYVYLSNLSNDDVYFLFVRLLYPSFYFDMCESIINNIVDEKDLLNVINKIGFFENNIKDVYNYFRTFTTLPEIEWLIKM